MMRKILVLSCGHVDENGGIEKYCSSIKELLKEHVNIEVCYKNSLSYYRRINRKRYVYKWTNIIQEIKQYDVIHVNGYLHFAVLQALVISKLLHKKIIYSPHFHPFKYNNHPFVGWLWFMVVIRPLLTKDIIIMTINNEDYAYFKHHTKSKVYRVPHWIRSDEQSSLKPKQDYLLFIGRNCDNKGISYLQRIPSGKYNVVIVSDKPLPRNDFMYYSNLNDQELRVVLSKASLLLVPSRYEAFSLVSMEALSLGVPILVSDNVRIIDYLDGISGVTVFHYGDVEDFLRKIGKAKEEKVDLEKVRNIFSRNSISESYYRVYSNI